jgi:hypothetical protein
MVRIFIFLLIIFSAPFVHAECSVTSWGQTVCDWYWSNGGSPSDITSTEFQIDLCNLDPVNSCNSTITGWSSSITALLKKIGDFLLFLTPLIAWIATIVAGYYYVLSSWDTEKASRAKTIIKWNAIGITLALCSYAIIALVASLLDANI